MSYSDKLRDPRWQKKRLEILNRDDFQCQLCLDKDTELHVHHKSYSGEPWETDSSELITYCKHCHHIVEDSKKKNYTVVAIKKVLLVEDKGAFMMVLFFDETIGHHIALIDYDNKRSDYNNCTFLFKQDLGDMEELIKLSRSNGQTIH